MRQKSVAVGVVLLLLVGAFVIYSFALKEWCARRVAWGEQVYGEEMGKCVKEKSWLDF